MTQAAAHAAAWAAARRVRVGGRAVRFREAGAGQPLVLVHGLGVSADYWSRNGSPLATAGFRVLAPDLPGFGRTAGPGVLPVAAQAEALRRWAGALGLGPATWVGHSLAAQAVLQLAADHPAAASALVLAAPTGAPRCSPLLHQLCGLLRDVAREPPELIPPVAQAYLRAGIPRVWRTWRAGTRHDPLPLLPRICCPALVVVGDGDPIVSRSYAELLGACLPDGRLQWIPGAAHAVHFGRPADFNRAVACFAGAALRERPTVPPVPMPAAAPSARGVR